MISGRQYTVRVRCTVDGEPFERRFRFTTLVISREPSHRK